MRDRALRTALLAIGTLVVPSANAQDSVSGPSKSARISGVVHLAAVISASGTIQDLKVISGHPLLIPAALEAVKQWVYQPTLLNGEPVEVQTQIDVNFTLSQ